MGDGSWAERRGAVVKESLTHLPPSWLRPPTPIPRTHRHDTLLLLLLSPSSTLHPSLLHFHQLPPHRPSPSLSGYTPSLVDAWLAASAVGCRLPSCLPADQVVPNTTKSIYPRCTQRPLLLLLLLLLSFRLSLSFSTHPFERYADPHIDRGARTLFAGKAGAGVRSRRG